MKKAAAVLILEDTPTRVGRRIYGFERSKSPGISLPGGKLEPGETFEQAAIREVYEETGMVVTLSPPLDPFIGYDVTNGFMVATFIGTPVAGTVPARYECAEGTADWNSIADVANGPYMHYDRQMFRWFGTYVPLIGKFHSHITINGDIDQVRAFAKATQSKLTAIDLQLMGTSQRDYMVTRHFVTGIAPGFADEYDVVDWTLGQQHAAALAGVEIVRTKVEHEYLHPHTLQNQVSAADRLIYRECHIKCEVPEESSAALTEVRAIGERSGWPTSRNVTHIPAGGKALLFLNRRFPATASDIDVDGQVVVMVNKLIKAGIDIAEIKYENIVHDSNTARDAWWGGRGSSQN